MLLAAPEGWEHIGHFRSKLLLQGVLRVYTGAAKFYFFIFAFAVT
jgi:hypothetical protein